MRAIILICGMYFKAIEVYTLKNLLGVLSFFKKCMIDLFFVLGFVACSDCGGWGLVSVVARGFPSVAASLAVERGLSSAGSVAVAHGLSCSTARGGIPDWGLNCVPCIDRRALNHWTTREVQSVHFDN